tara:strand:- start:1962 stop:3134 length:1173 start_codon:yes stop_codon:yes gene_type:complete
MNIAIVGLGYVGTSLAALLSRKHPVIAIDIDPNKVNSINSRVSPINDNEIITYFENNSLNISATLDPAIAYENADFIIICTQTNYDPDTNKFDVSSIYSVINDISNINSLSTIIIKSTVPVGFTKKIQEEYPHLKIIFSPEFLREDKALYDNLYPSRIIIGDSSDKAKEFSRLLIEISNYNKKKVNVLFMQSSEAEATKLFANTYLAMRVAYFNELDSYCEIHNLSTRQVIDGVSLDPRIGDYYNNPSFGYGGYCLPKDTQQLLRNFDDIPNNIIKAVVESNSTRKDFLSEQIIKNKPNTVGIYRLVMKDGSNNFRESAILGIMKRLKEKNILMNIYEPLLDTVTYEGINVINNLESFINKSDIIVANRINEDLKKVENKVYTRDLFKKN